MMLWHNLGFPKQAAHCLSRGIRQQQGLMADQFPGG
jgi:hypothetical protein